MFVSQKTRGVAMSTLDTGLAAVKEKPEQSMQRAFLQLMDTMELFRR